MGSKMVIFDGNAAAPDFQDLYLHGEIDGANGMALTMRDVVGEWNDMVPAFKIPINDVPDGWGLEDVSFTFAPEDGHFGNVYYTAGFGFKVCYNFFLFCFFNFVFCATFLVLALHFLLSILATVPLFVPAISRLSCYISLSLFFSRLSFVTFSAFRSCCFFFLVLFRLTTYIFFFALSISLQLFS